MSTPDLQTAIDAAHEYAQKFNECVAVLDFKHDEETALFWSVFLGCMVSTGVKKSSKQTIAIILNSLIIAIQQDEIKANFH